MTQRTLGWDLCLFTICLLGVGLLLPLRDLHLQAESPATEPVSAVSRSDPKSAGTRQPAALARPIALSFLHHSQKLLLASRDTATLTTIDPAQRTILANWTLPGAEQLNDMLVSRDEQTVIVCSTKDDRIWLLGREENGEFRIKATHKVPSGPVGLCWIPAGNEPNRFFAVASQWGRAITILDSDSAASESTVMEQHRISLPHSPRRMIVLQNGARLLAADAFNGAISVLDTATGKLERTLKIPGQNIHGLMLMPDGQRIIVAHQILNQLAETSHDGVFWGLVMTNNLRIIPLENFLSSNRKPLEDADIHFLGEPKHGAADPTDLALGRYETMLTTLGGTDELAIGVHLDHSFDRVKVGRRPIAVVTDTSSRIAYVANQFSDSVSIVEIDARKNLGEISLWSGPPGADGRPPEESLVQKGEALFHSASLSLDNWYSCHSCHTSGHTIGLLNDNLGDGNYGAPKRIPSLLGIADTAPYLWSGRRSDLIEQSRKSITTTMHGAEPTEEQLRQLAAYMETLPPPPRLESQNGDKVALGAKLFDTHGCAKCHTPPAYTSAEVYDVGIQDQHGRREFNPPSLRGVRLREEYFHDHRASSLRDVFSKHQHPRAKNWSVEELDHLLAFLESL